MRSKLAAANRVRGCTGFHSALLPESIPTADDRLDTFFLETNVLNSEPFHLGLLRFVGRYIDLPARLLQILTELAMHVPEALWLLSTHLQPWGRPPAAAESKHDQALLRFVTNLLRQSGLLPYSDLRKDIAEFFRYECINCTILIDALQQMQKSRVMLAVDNIPAQITRDLSFLLTCEWNWIFLHSCGPPESDEFRDFGKTAATIPACAGSVAK